MASSSLSYIGAPVRRLYQKSHFRKIVVLDFFWQRAVRISQRSR